MSAVSYFGFLITCLALSVLLKNFIQLLEEPMKQKAGDNEQDAYYRVAVKTAAGIDEQYYTRFSETNETTPRIVSVYEKDGQGLEHETVLFTYSVK